MVSEMLRDKYKGCLLGLAVGDALGAPVEFLSRGEINDLYGPAGIVDFDSWGEFRPGSYTDDTQLALATAEGCVWSADAGEEAFARIIYRRYLKWFSLQSDAFYCREPGRTCLSALGSGESGTLSRPINNSKGCGGVMRTAPVGLAFPPGEAFIRGVECAAITHGNPSGYLPAGFLADVVARLVAGNPFGDALSASSEILSSYQGHADTLNKLNLALSLASEGAEPVFALPQLGEGWTGEEALSLSVYCALRYQNDWELGTLCAVNHSGDSDSTGAIAGALLGTMLGAVAVPARWVSAVEDSEKIVQLADDMFTRFQSAGGDDH